VCAVVRSSTALVFTVPRIFMDDTAEDRRAIQPVLSQINVYPLSQFDGKVKVKDWSKLPHFPAPKSTGKGETKWVNPETFFDELPAVMKSVPPHSPDVRGNIDFRVQFWFSSICATWPFAPVPPFKCVMN
jgi:hypothetical protein